MSGTVASTPSIHLNPPSSTPALLFDRRTALFVCGAAALHLGLTAAGLPAWKCPVRAALGIPCPGCGLSRATLALISGDWQRALHLHALAPLIVIGVPLLAVLALLPLERRTQFAARWTAIDRRWHLGWILLAAFIGYWLLRLALDTFSFVDHKP